MFDDQSDFDDHHFGALDAGAAYALYRHGQDVQTEEITRAIAGLQPGQTVVDVHVHLDQREEHPAPVNALDYATADMPESWDDYIGQEPLKRQLTVAIKSAQVRGESLPHVLLASGMPGVGKTTMARLIAKTMDKRIIELIPPFDIYTLVEAAQKLDDGDILFIDEIHLATTGRRSADKLFLKIMEDKVAFLPDGDVAELDDITIIGATTDKDLLPETVIDRFKIRPYFQAYSVEELARICVSFAFRHDCWPLIGEQLCTAIAFACRGTPRIIEEFVMGARDLAITLGRVATVEELLQHMEVEPDGLTRTHIHYLTAMRQYFARENANGELEYIVGEAAITQILRETKQGIGRVERFLIERGLIDRTPRGRRLTPRGIARAEALIAAGKGASDV